MISFIILFKYTCSFIARLSMYFTLSLSWIFMAASSLPIIYRSCPIKIPCGAPLISLWDVDVCWFFFTFIFLPFMKSKSALTKLLFIPILIYLNATIVWFSLSNAADQIYEIKLRSILLGHLGIYIYFYLVNKGDKSMLCVHTFPPLYWCLLRLSEIPWFMRSEVHFFLLLFSK